MAAPHHLQAWWSSWCPTNSVKALMAVSQETVVDKQGMRPVGDLPVWRSVLLSFRQCFDTWWSHRKVIGLQEMCRLSQRFSFWTNEGRKLRWNRLIRVQQENGGGDGDATRGLVCSYLEVTNAQWKNFTECARFEYLIFFAMSLIH